MHELALHQNAVPTDSRDCESESADRVALLRAVLKALEASGCRYALIHAERDLEAAASSDVDIAFDTRPHEIVLPIIRQLSTTYGARLIQCLHYEIPHGYYYVLRVAGARCRFLHLDCLYDPLGVNRYRLPTPFLLEGAITGPWGKQTSKERMAIYLLMKRAIKGSASSEALDVLRTCFSDASDALWSDVRRWFGPRARPLIAQLLEAKSAERAAVILARLRLIADRTFRRKHPLRYLQSFPMNAMRKVRRFVQPTGLFVVVMGPDGAGKSTVTGLVMARLARAFRRTWRFHWRPGLLPKLGRRGRANEGHETAEAPPELSKYRGVVSLARFLYYWLDFMAGYWLRIYPRKAQTTLVLGERYFPDVLVHPQRYGFAVPRWLMRLAAACVPSPDLLVLLRDDPEVIYARKPELSRSVLAAQLAAYGDEMKHWGKAVTITTEGGAEAVAGRVCDLILDVCADRTARRLERYSRQPGWRGFPSAASAKVWVSDQDSLSNALNLYHAYSSFGRFAKWLICLLPPQVHRRLLADPPDLQTADRLNFLTQIICKTLRTEKISVSFSTGTRGPHRKLTAQASYGGNVLSYVKIGNTSAHFKLLQQEADMLRWLHGREIDTAVLPKILAFEASEQHQLLFLSAPMQPGKPRPLQPDEKDARFLSELISDGHRNVAASEVFEAIDSTAFLATVRQTDSSAATTLQAAMESVCNVFGQTGIRLAPCHGDYAPWNTLELQDGSLYVFDWEYSSKEAPLFTDLFHRVLMPARLVFRQPPGRVIARLLDLCKDPVLGSVISRSGIERPQLPGYLLVYLIRLAMREAGAEENLSEFLVKAIEHSLSAFAWPVRRRNVLVAAYACEPGRGSEPGVGWNMCQAISQEHNTWVITRKNNQEQIEQALAQHPNPNLHFRYADLPYWARFWKRGGRGIRTYYYLWQFAAWREARRLMWSVHFDLAHHVTFVNSYMFSFLALLPLPFVWGPIGINPRSPADLASSLTVLVKNRLRYGFQQLLRIVDPLYWLCVVRARLIIGINPDVGRQFPISVLGNTKFVCHTAIGVEDDFPDVGIRQCGGNGIRVLSMGQLIPIKGFHLAIRALAELVKSKPPTKLVIVGDGPEKPRLEQLAADLGVGENVEFVAWLPRHEALSMMNHADVFLFPSFEGAGMVVLEAMAHGLPVVCLGFGGPGDMVTRDCGFPVEIGNMNDTVTRLGVALKTLTQDRSMRLRMGAAARQRIAQTYLWKNRHEIITQWYSKVVSDANRHGLEVAAMPKGNDWRNREVS
jgi:glycosyltransferase involved in cell wall biosynthesis/thymidylate kinase